MRLISYLSSEGPRTAAVRGQHYVDLARAGLPASMRALLALGQEGLQRAARVVVEGPDVDPATIKKLLPPVPDPRKIICVGLNYADHAREGGSAPPEEPVIFCKFPTALIAHGDPIVLPNVSRQVDYEAELVVVIGRGGRHIPRDRAFEHIVGYCPGHDVSARDWQTGKPGRQWLLGKTFDTFAPCGPALVTRDEVPDPGKLPIRFRLNGETMQNSNTNQFIFPVDELVAYVSQVCTLEPGDLLYTGTPPGVGFARKPPVFLKPGDVAEVEIEGLGVLRNPVVAEELALTPRS
jgi:2-keto-4-pentenoate hydratase/2-oxohepta-3-ene-1,7-dioic acid hydratase in catechol pathway